MNEHRETFYRHLNAYDTRDILRGDFYETVMEIRKGMIPRTRFEKLDMLKYKRAILFMVKEKFRDNFTYDFTDDEVIENRVKTIKGLENTKITKVISKAIKENDNVFSRDTKFLDYFHKLQDEDEEYYLSSDPNDLLQAYSDVSTCVSPNGDNIANIFQFLTSPYIYIAYTKRNILGEHDKEIKNRAIVYLDFANRVFSLGQIYGSFNMMFELALLSFLRREEFNISTSVQSYFNLETLHYMESGTGDLQYYASFFGMKDLRKDSYDKRISIHSKPYYINVENDAITGDGIFGLGITTKHLINIGIKSARGTLLDEYEEICGDCGEIVGSEYYDYDYELCDSCLQYADRNYCERCDNSFPDSEFDMHMDMCNSCAYEAEEEDNADEQYERHRDEQLLKEEQ